MVTYKKITHKLLEWHTNTPRALVWKTDTDAYSIWLSEIIMQQTRVEQGSKYYVAFKQAFPTVFDLAAAPIEEVIKLWEGLGYYSRARNLHHTAKTIVEQYKGKFPETPKEIEKLKGIGPYTAAAIASFAFNYPKAAIDGNAYRVLARLFNIDTPINTSAAKKQFQKIGDSLLHKQTPGTFNQALMNFGALVCRPKNPDCMACVLQPFCLAFEKKTVASRPVKSKAIKKTKRYFNYLWFKNEKHTWIKERTGKDVWQNLYEFPLIETQSPMSEDEVLLLAQEEGLLPNQFTVKRIHNDLKQVLSHRIIYAKILELSVENVALDGFSKIELKQVNQYPFPRMLKQFLTQLGYT